MLDQTVLAFRLYSVFVFMLMDALLLQPGGLLMTIVRRLLFRYVSAVFCVPVMALEHFRKWYGSTSRY